MKTLKLFLPVIAVAILIASCSKDESNTPVDPQPALVIYQNTGLVDSIFYGGSGYTSQTRSLITSPYNFTAIDSVVISFSYVNYSRDTSPVSICYIQNTNAIPFYTKIDNSVFDSTAKFVSVVVPSPKVNATIASTLRNRRQAGDPNGYTVLRNLSVTKK